jgi:hypothetical protein
VSKLKDASKKKNMPTKFYKHLDMQILEFFVIAFCSTKGFAPCIHTNVTIQKIDRGKVREEFVHFFQNNGIFFAQLF